MQQSDWSRVERETLSPRLTRRFIYDGTSSMSILDYETGASVPDHNHPHEQVSYIQSGRVEVTAGARKYVVGAGQTIIVPPYVRHSFRALEPTVNIDFHAPIREDWIAARDAARRTPSTPNR